MAHDAEATLAADPVPRRLRPGTWVPTAYLAEGIPSALVVWVAGMLQEDRGLDARTAWGYALCLSAFTLAGLGIYHMFALPTGSVARRPSGAVEVARTFVDTVRDFLRKPKLWGMLLFV